jgi:hypothetical protein
LSVNQVKTRQTGQSDKTECTDIPVQEQKNRGKKYAKKPNIEPAICSEIIKGGRKPNKTKYKRDFGPGIRENHNI